MTVWQDRPVPVLGRLSSECLPRPVCLTLEILVRCIPQQCAVTQQENRLYSPCRSRQAGSPCSGWHMGGPALVEAHSGTVPQTVRIATGLFG